MTSKFNDTTIRKAHQQTHGNTWEVQQDYIVVRHMVLIIITNNIVQLVTKIQ